jgi:hypothetical protein
VLKITITETLTEKRCLQGRLVGPWVGELRTSWEKTHRDQWTNVHFGPQRCDVSNKDAEKLLQAMSKKGTQFVADGIYIKQVLEQLKRRSKRGRTHEGATL